MLFLCPLLCSVQVGLMRDGQLLAESEPNALISHYGMRVISYLHGFWCYIQQSYHHRKILSHSDIGGSVSALV